MLPESIQTDLGILDNAFDLGVDLEVEGLLLEDDPDVLEAVLDLPGVLNELVGCSFFLPPHHLEGLGHEGLETGCFL